VISAPDLSAAAKNKAIPPAEKKITKAKAVTTAKAALKPIPAKLPASQVTPGAQKAILRTRRRSLQMVLRLLAAAAAGHWLGNRLNDYLRDPDEYRAITRHLLHLGGTITCTPRAITVTLDPPGRTPDRPRPRPAHRGDQRDPAPHARRHAAHHLPARGTTQDLTTIKDRLPEV
jgi:hypothetical protein